MIESLLTASKPELLVGGDDLTLRALLHDYFAFARNLEESRAKFANYVGLSATQYMILIAVAHSNQDEPTGVSQIAGQLHLSGAFVTIEVNKLVAEGLINKNAHPSDGRRVQLAASEEGLDRLARLAAFQRPVNDALFGTLTGDEFKLLSRLIARLAAGGDKAVKLAGHVEATISQGYGRKVAPAADAPIAPPRTARIRI